MRIESWAVVLSTSIAQALAWHHRHVDSTQCNSKLLGCYFNGQEIMRKAFHFAFFFVGFGNLSTLDYISAQFECFDCIVRRFCGFSSPSAPHAASSARKDHAWRCQQWNVIKYKGCSFGILPTLRFFVQPNWQSRNWLESIETR